MGLRTECYAKVWSAKENGKVYSAQVSVSYKDKETGKYRNSYNGYVTFGGDAAKKVRELGLPERMDRNDPHYRSIKITSSPDITNNYNADYINKMISLAKGNDELVNFIKRNASPASITIWDFEVADDDGKKVTKSSGKTSAKRRDPEPEDDDDADDDLPF